MSSAWECRDQADQAEIYYNQPLRIKNRRLEEENMTLKRLLRENGISWRSQGSSDAQSLAARVTRSSSKRSKVLPHLPVEIQLRILSYAMTSPFPIVDPLSKPKADRLIAREKTKANKIAIHFLATCKAYHVEGTQFLWRNNSFVFTTPEALRNFAEVPLVHRQTISSINFRIIAKFYDDEDRIRKLPSTHHPDFKKSPKLVVHRRPKEHTLARRGFRVYAYYQLIDFLEAMLPPFQPAEDSSDLENVKSQKRPRLLPNLERLRIDFVNFGEDMLMFPPAQLHDLACHQMGRSLNEVVLTGLPSDDAGFRVSTELGGLLRDEGLLIDHAPTMVALKNGVRLLPCDDDVCRYSSKVVRAMSSTGRLHLHDHHDHPLPRDEFPPAPKERGEPPPSAYHSCRTIWKRVPVKLDDPDNRKWELYDRVSGLPWDDVEEEIMFMDMMEDELESPECENCGKRHLGAVSREEYSDLYDEDID
ncbi:hypothetical protein DL768_009851 [Monosporascus sp. mg162]|nr:hypothetical protein DL768_009851 [Monosporascus sp. mg162]